MIFWMILRETPVGNFLLIEEDGKLIRASYTESDTFSEPEVRAMLSVSEEEELYNQETPFLQKVSSEIEEYFIRQRKEFTVPYRFSGTDFQEQVWNVIASIGYGKTLTYGEIAQQIGKPGAARAVGNACGSNPIPLIVPCHRVTASNGGLGGYSSGLDKKRQLLDLENRS